MKIGELKKAVSEKNLRSLARLISHAENQDLSLYPLIKDLYGELGKAKVIGFTGPPGAGKSTLVNDYVRYVRAKKEAVAVVAVDPISPFTGGALLGDRIRLTEHFNDDGVYIRSLSTRGKLGGLSLATRQVVHLLDAFGFGNILIETVGVGQSEVDIRTSSELTAVVLVPEWGDSIQALKAGLLEIGDLFIVNKSDREGADRVVNELKTMLHMANRESVPVFSTSQQDKASLEQVWKWVDGKYADKDQSWRSQKKSIIARAELFDLVQDYVAREGKNWIGQSLDKAGNPYEHFLDFIKRHPAGSLFGK